MRLGTENMALGISAFSRSVQKICTPRSRWRTREELRLLIAQRDTSNVPVINVTTFTSFTSQPSKAGVAGFKLRQGKKWTDLSSTTKGILVTVPFEPVSSIFASETCR